MYSVKAITNLTGLSPETLRAWERRYTGISPERGSNGRRIYSQSDLEKLTLLAELTRSGHSIGKIAALSTDDLRALQQGQNNRQDLLLAQIIDALQSYRIDRCEQLLKRALLAKEPLDYVCDILLPALKSVGDLWHRQELSVAQEHIFSSCVKRIVLTMVNNLHPPVSNHPGMLFATPSGEDHEFGILLCSLLASSLQYRCFYLGANLPGRDIAEAVGQLRPKVIVLGLINTPPDESSIEQLGIVLNAQETADSAIWLGGEGAAAWRHGRPENECELVTDIRHFYDKARQRLLIKAN